MCTLQTGKPCYNTSNYYRSSLCLYKCRTARELNFSSVTPISRNVSCRRVYGITKGYKGNTHKDTKIMRKICWSSQFMTKILSEENVFQISAVPTGVYVRTVYGRYPPVLKSCGLYPFHGALQVPTLMGVLASVCTPSAPLPTRKQQLPTSSAQQCWEFLRPFARTYKKKITG